MKLRKEEIYQVWEQDKKKERKILLIFLLATVFVFLFSLCFRYEAYYFEDYFVPKEYFHSIFTSIRFFFARILNLDSYGEREKVIEAIGDVVYVGGLTRLKVTLMSFVAGAGIAIAGATFQTIYKNPMASPNMLGATAGVNLGNILMVVLYSSSALNLVFLRYKYCYALTAICVVVVLILGKIAGDRKGTTSVMEMVMVGSIISQGLNVFVMYSMYNLEDEDLLIYQELNLGTYLQTDTISLRIFFIVMAVALIPIIFLRYRFNVVGFDDAQAKTIGINPAPFRLLGQICAIIMVTAAMIHCGQIGMLSMVIPYLVRTLVGADFKKVCIYSGLTGGTVLMICRLLTSFVLIADEPIPVTFILNIALTPAFLFILAKRNVGIR